MSKNILIISEQSFKDFTPASGNIDLKNVTMIIKMAQDRYVHPICGTALYDKILSLIPTGDLKNNPAFITYKDFVDDYLTDVLFNYVLSELPMSSQYKYVNKGVKIRTSENTTEPDFDELRNVMAFYRGYAEWYAERAINFLCANSTLFPEYMNPGNDVTTIQPASNQYRSSIYLGNGDMEDTRPYSEKYQGDRYKKPY
jgi:hypothetical protein